MDIMKKSILTITFCLFTILTTQAQYASLAIDQNAGERYGWAVEYETRAEADKRALSECEKNGSECHIVLRFNGGCGAYVVERGNNSLYGWGTGNTEAIAKSRAMEEARIRGGKDLVVRVWGCNGGNLIKAEEGEKVSEGVFYFHYTYSTSWDKCFITDLLFLPSSAVKSGEEWVWAKDAESRMTPPADKFWAFVENDLYGYLGAYKDKAYTRESLDWEGTNEVKYNNEALDMNLKDRKERIEKGRQSIIQQMEDKGYEIIYVNVNN